MNNIGSLGGYGAITAGESALQGARMSSDKGKFEAMLDELRAESAAERGNAEPDGRLNGDWTSGFSGTFTAEADKRSRPVGAAANQANPHVRQRTVDRTSKLYEKSLEMESYIVKMMLSQMRKTVMKADGQESYARSMYEDMLYDEYATVMTKGAGFGLADQMYLQLSAGDPPAP